MDQDEYFNTLQKMVQDTHDFAHQDAALDNDATKVVGVLDGLLDVMTWLVNSSSWDGRSLPDYDKHLLASEIEGKVLWRLK